MLTVLRFCETEAARREAGSTGMRSAAEDLSCSTPHGGTKVVYLINPSSTHTVVSSLEVHILRARSSRSTYTCRAPMITQDTAHDASTSAGDRYHWLRWRKVYRRFHHDKGRDANTGSSICSGELLQQRLQALCRHYCALDKGRSCSTASEANCKIIHTTTTPQHTLSRHPGPSPVHTLAIMGQNETMP